MGQKIETKIDSIGRYIRVWCEREQALTILSVPGVAYILSYSQKPNFFIIKVADDFSAVSLNRTILNTFNGAWSYEI